MKEKRCENCKNVIEGIEDARFGGRVISVCQKNGLCVEKPNTHSCDMHEEKIIVNDYIVQKLELVKSGVSVTLTDENNQWVSDIILSSWAAKDLRVGDKFRISYR